MHEVNPFEVFKIKERHVIRKGFEKQVVEVDSGSVMTLRPIDKSITGSHDYASYVKLFKEGLAKVMLETSTPARAILVHIMQTLKPGQSEIELRHSKLQAAFRELRGGSYYRGVKELIDKGFMAASVRGKHYYWINSNYFFNGDRRRIKNK